MAASANGLIGATVRDIRLPDEAARARAREIQKELTKPSGSLGRLEELHVWVAGIRREPMPVLRDRLIAVAAADHGVAREGISAYPQDVTHQMIANFLDRGAAVNVLAAHAGARVRVVDAGVARDTDDTRLHVAKLGAGTASIAHGPAMPHGEAVEMIARGIVFARDACGAGADVIALGDMGIGNTTVAAAMTAVLTGTSPAMTVGRGTGLDDAALESKVRIVERAIALNAPDASDAVDVLAKLGGYEIAFLAGVGLGAAATSVPVVLDGYPTTAAALVAASIAPAAREYLLAAHMSAEPGHRLALEHLGLRPLLDLHMRLGEGTGAALALTLLDAALRIPREMATFASAGVSGRADASAGARAKMRTGA